MGCCGSVDVNENVNEKSNELENINNLDDSTLIQTYIEEDCNFRKSIGSNINLEKQSKKQRIEIICMGCFLYKNKEMIQNNKLEILVRDNVIQNTKYRPDLIFRRNNRVFHIEIDENSHSNYDKDKEQERYQTIKNYCLTRYGTYNLIRFNPNVYGKLDSEHDKVVIAEQFALLLSNIDGLLLFERC